MYKIYMSPSCLVYISPSYLVLHLHDFKYDFNTIIFCFIFFYPYLN